MANTVNYYCKAITCLCRLNQGSPDGSEVYYDEAVKQLIASGLLKTAVQDATRLDEKYSCFYGSCVNEGTNMISGNILNVDGSISRLYNALMSLPASCGVCFNLLYRFHRIGIFRIINQDGSSSITVTETRSVPGLSPIATPTWAFKVEGIHTEVEFISFMVKYTYARLNEEVDMSVMDGSVPKALHFTGEIVIEDIGDTAVLYTAWTALALHYDVPLDAPASPEVADKTCADFKVNDRVKLIGKVIVIKNIKGKKTSITLLKDSLGTVTLSRKGKVHIKLDAHLNAGVLYLTPNDLEVEVTTNKRGSSAMDSAADDESSSASEAAGAATVTVEESAAVGAQEMASTQPESAAMDSTAAGDARSASDEAEESAAVVAQVMASTVVVCSIVRSSADMPLGIDFCTASEASTEALRNYQPQNLLAVKAVNKNSPAFAAGIQPGDVIFAVNGTLVMLEESEQALGPGVALLKSLPVSFTIIILRGGRFELFSGSSRISLGGDSRTVNDEEIADDTGSDLEVVTEEQPRDDAMDSEAANDLRSSREAAGVAVDTAVQESAAVVAQEMACTVLLLSVERASADVPMGFVACVAEIDDHRFSQARDFIAVESVNEGSPAFAADFQRGDMLFSMNGLLIKPEDSEFAALLDSLPASFDVCIIRGSRFDHESSDDEIVDPGTGSDVPPPPYIPTKEDIMSCRVRLMNLLNNVIPGRKRTRKGRPSKHELARREYIVTTGLPNLLRGKLPSINDEKALFLPHATEVDGTGKHLLTVKESKWMDAWSDKVHRDPRKADVLSTAKQKSILLYAAGQDPSVYGSSGNPSRGAHSVYRFLSSEGSKWSGFPGAGQFANMTLREVLRRTRRSGEFSKWESGVAFIKWVCSETFVWKRPLVEKHAMLYHELAYLEENGAVYWDGGGQFELRLPPKAKVAYQGWVHTLKLNPHGYGEQDEDAVLVATVAARGGSIQTQAEAEAVVRAERRLDDAEVGLLQDGEGIAIDLGLGDGDAGDGLDEDDDGDGNGDSAGVAGTETLELVLLSKAEKKAKQMAFCKSITRRLSTGDLNLSDTKSVPTLVIHPPDWTRVVPFDVANITVKPIALCSPSESHRAHGVEELPCMKGYCGHTVRLSGWYAPREVRGMCGRDFFVAGRGALCIDCQKESKALKKLLAAKVVEVEAAKAFLELAEVEDVLCMDTVMERTEAYEERGAEAAVLQGAIKAKPHRFSAANPVIIERVLERHPFVAYGNNWMLRHRSGLDASIVGLAARTNSAVQTPSDLAAMLSELDAIQHEQDSIACAALQVHVHKRAQTTMDEFLDDDDDDDDDDDGSATALRWCDLGLPRTPISDTLLRDVAIEMAEKTEKYKNQFTEQMVGGERFALDHSNKLNARARVNGVKSHPYVLAGMFVETGAVPILIATSSTSYNDPAAKGALTTLRKLHASDGRAPVSQATLDKPGTDGPIVRSHLALKGQANADLPDLDMEAVEILVVVDEAACDRACEDLRAAQKPLVIGFDSEYKAPLPAGDVRKAATVQLCASSSKVYVFQVHRWGHCFESFKSFMSDKNVRKVAHYKSADINPLQSRFPDLVVAGVEDLKPIAMRAAKTVMLDNSLATYARTVLKVSMPWKDSADHSQWEAINLDAEQRKYAAADALVVWLIVQRAEAPAQVPQKTSVMDEADNVEVEDVDLSDDEAPEPGARAACSRPRQRLVSRPIELEVGPLYELVGCDGDDSDVEEGEIEHDKAEEDDEDDEPPQACHDLVTYCEARIVRYWLSSSTDEVKLPAGLTSVQRRVLHAKCDQLGGLSHRTRGGEAGESQDRRFCFQRRSTFSPVASSVGEDAIGCLVLLACPGVAVGEQEGRRGIVTGYSEGRSNDADVETALGVAAAAGVPTWEVSFEGGSVHTIGLDALNDGLLARWKSDEAAGSSSSSAPPSTPTFAASFVGALKDEAFLQRLLDGVAEEWHKQDAVLTPYDMRHFLSNCMAMCRAGPESSAYRRCIADLADVFFKQMRGERERLIREGADGSQFSRAFFKRNSRYVMPPPHAQIKDFYDWFLFWSNYPHPDDPTKSFFVPDAQTLFVKECKYIQKGQTSDRPGFVYYVKVRVTKFGRTVYRCLRSNSALEGFHAHIRRASDSCAKHAGPRVQHYRLNDIGFRWNVRSLCKASVIPSIKHYELHLRDRLCDIARGTPLEKLRALEGWRRVDQTIEPTVPRGIVVGLLDASLLDKKQRKGPSKVPHSKQSSASWAEETWGHAAPVDLTQRGDIQTVLQEAGAVILAQPKPTNDDISRVRAASGLLPTKGGLSSLASRLADRQNLNAMLKQHGHEALSAQLQAPAPSWQTASEASLPAPVQNLGAPGPLPTAFGGGAAAATGSGGVVVGVHGPEGADGNGGGGSDGNVVGAASYVERERKRMKTTREDPAKRFKENVRQRWRRALQKAEKDGTVLPEWDAYLAMAMECAGDS